MCKLFLFFKETANEAAAPCPQCTRKMKMADAIDQMTSFIGLHFSIGISFIRIGKLVK